MRKSLTAPLSADVVKELRAGDAVSISGTIYVARDAAHKKMVDGLQRGEKLPFNPEGAVIYYMGPSPAKPGRPIGSAGPTTSYRMDPYTETMLQQGALGFIGKGRRAQVVKDALVKYGGVYFAAVGGAAALIARSIKEAELIAFPELGAEAVLRLVVQGFPAVVVNDTEGNDLYESARRQWAQCG